MGSEFSSVAAYIVRLRSSAHVSLGNPTQPWEAIQRAQSMCLFTAVVTCEAAKGSAMRRLVAVICFVCAVLAVTQTGSVLGRQEGTPPAAEEVVLPEGVTSEILAIAATEAIPLPPALMELIRFTVEPGAEIRLPEQSPSTALVLVESGTLTARVGAPVMVTRSSVGGQQEMIDAGSEYTAGVGDFFIGPAHTAVEARNEGSEPLVLLMAVIEPVAETVGAGTPTP
jgi:quercetin dioxygenase-like cupin family protein